MNQLLGLAPGAAIECGGRRYVITHILSLEAILAKDQETGRSLELKLGDITPPTQLSLPEKTVAKDLALIEQNDWTNAEQWFSRLHPLLSGRRTDEMVRAVAQEAGVHRTTVYRKLARYEQTRIQRVRSPAGSVIRWLSAFWLDSKTYTDDEQAGIRQNGQQFRCGECGRKYQEDYVSGEKGQGLFPFLLRRSPLVELYLLDYWRNKQI